LLFNNSAYLKIGFSVSSRRRDEILKVPKTQSYSLTYAGE